MDSNMKLDVRIYPVREPKGNLLSFASVTINDCFAVNGVKVTSGEKGLLVNMPSTKDSKGKYRDVCFPVTAEFRQQINRTVLEEYSKFVQNDTEL